MDELTERRVLLRWAPDDREGPDRVVAVIDRFDLEDRELVGQAVVAEVIAEWPFGKSPRRVDATGDDEVGFRGNREAVAARDAKPRDDSASPRTVARQALREGHHRGKSMRGRSSYENAHAERLAATDRGGVMNADASMDLIVKPDVSSPRSGFPRAARGTSRGSTSCTPPPSGCSV